MLMVNCGYTWEHIDNHMTLPKLAALRKYWSRVPPMDTMIAGIAMALGYNWKAAARPKKAEKSEADLQKALDAFAAAGFQVKVNKRG